jgi:hypothetical protein
MNAIAPHAGDTSETGYARAGSIGFSIVALHIEDATDKPNESLNLAIN